MVISIQVVVGIEIKKWFLINKGSDSLSSADRCWWHERTSSAQDYLLLLAALIFFDIYSINLLSSRDIKENLKFNLIINSAVQQ